MPRQTGELMRRRIEQAIADLTAENGRPPTNREIGLRVGGKSTGHIDYHLRYMRENGTISHEPRKSRGITLLKPSESLNIPVQPVRIQMAGQIAAGRPIEVNELTDEYIDITTGLGRGGEVYALRVKGTSMIEDHIDDGDVVIVRREAYINDGDTVVAVLKNDESADGGATLKRFYRDKSGMVRLEPRNPELKPFLVDPKDLEIRGKLVAVLRQI